MLSLTSATKIKENVFKNLFYKFKFVAIYQQEFQFSHHSSTDNKNIGLDDDSLDIEIIFLLLVFHHCLFHCSGIFILCTSN